MPTVLLRARTRRVATIGLALALTSCDSLLAPNRLDGAYALIAVDAAPLPALVPSVLTAMGGAELSVLADTVTFSGGGRGRWQNLMRRRDIASGTEETFQTDVPFRYRVERGIVLLTFFDCRSDCRVAATERVGRVTRDELRRSRGSEWRYVRVPR